MQLRRLLAPLALLLACTPKPADTEGESGSSVGETDGAEATSATETSPTTSAGPATAGPTSADPTSAGPTTASPTSLSSADGSADGTATEPATSTGTSTDTDEPGGGLPGACAAVCMHWDACAPGSAGPVEQCIAECQAGVGELSPCAMATATQWSCVAGLSCEEALKFVQGPGEPTSCLAEVDAVAEICFDPGCGGEISGGGDFCELEQDCEGLVQNFRCDTETGLCTCTENGVAGKECPEDGFCSLGSAEQRAAVNACCGWEWM